jgi:hypothetical protein
MGTSFLSKIFGNKGSVKTTWKPASRPYLNDPETEVALQDVGYKIVGRLTSAEIQKLNDLYADLHHFEKPNGGMFYSVYSRDLLYRNKVHNGIGQILDPIYGKLFNDYKSVLNSFIVKVSGPESEFSLHQDSTGLDEMKYSCLSIWIPLQDTGTDNGCMCVVPHSHKMFSPYRGISFPQAFDSISDTVRQYLQPIEMKAGDILLFDNRLVHNSVVNSSGQDRIVIMSGIFPEEASILSCYKDMSNIKNPIELIEQEDDYLLTFENFFHDCTCRPETGKSIGFVNWDTSQMSEQEFLSLCGMYGIKPVNHPAAAKSVSNQAIIGEPIAQ